jgi:hypothetical protein
LCNALVEITVILSIQMLYGLFYSSHFSRKVCVLFQALLRQRPVLWEISQSYFLAKLMPAALLKPSKPALYESIPWFYALLDSMGSAS